MDVNSLTEEQRNAVEASINRPILIVACPGSGKTFTLINRVIYLLKNGFNEDDLLIFSFTRKSAREISERLKNIGYFNINAGTFHSFGRRVLRRFGCFINMKEFRIIAEKEQLDILRNFVDDIADKKDLLRELRKFKEGLRYNTLYKSSFDRYDEALKSEKLCDFDDLIIKSVELLRQNRSIVDYLRRTYKYCLVDEMQDVSRSQYELLSILFRDTGRITVVGDDDQTIFSWRGAEPLVLKKYCEEFKDTEKHILSICFRCPKFITESMSACVKNNKFRMNKEIRSYLGPDSESKSIVLCSFCSQKHEANVITEKIKFLLNSRESVAILYRTNKDCEMIKRFLKSNKIPASKSIKKGFKTKQYNRIMDSLKYLLDVEYNKGSLKKDDMVTLNKESFEKLRDSLGTNTIRYVLEYIAEKLGIEGNAMDILLEESDYFDNVLDFETEMKVFEHDTDKNVVNLSTVHQAKGLEWDHVFIISANSRDWPNMFMIYRSLDAALSSEERRAYIDNVIEEERRLFYVAISRARKSLTISFEQAPCHFVEEIPKCHTVLHDYCSQVHAISTCEVQDIKTPNVKRSLAFEKPTMNESNKIGPANDTRSTKKNQKESVNQMKITSFYMSRAGTANGMRGEPLQEGNLHHPLNTTVVKPEGNDKNAARNDIRTVNERIENVEVSTFSMRKSLVSMVNSRAYAENSKRRNT